VRIEHSIVISAPPDNVWSVLADWDGQGGWMPDVAWVRVVGEQRELGATLAVRTKVFGIPALVDSLTVTVWRPPATMCIAHTGFVKGRGIWNLAPLGSGTRFTWTEWLRLPFGIVGECALWIYRPLQSALLRRSLRNVKAICESGEARERSPRKRKW
jgi:carbon monoxide dehydrogenase subunit G